MKHTDMKLSDNELKFFKSLKIFKKDSENLKQNFSKLKQKMRLKVLPTPDSLVKRTISNLK